MWGSLRLAATAGIRLLVAAGVWVTLSAVTPATPARAGGADLGLAGVYSLRARGVDAPRWNPATLAWSGALDLRIAGAGGTVYNNAFSLGDYGHWNGADLDEADKETILDRIPGDRFRGGIDVTVEGPGVARQGWALTTSGRAAGTAVLPKEYGRVIFYGNEPETSYDLRGAGGEGVSWSEVSLSHGRSLGTASLAGRRVAFAGGLTLEALRGWAYGEVIQARGSLTTTTEGIDGEQEMRERTAQGAGGYGCDLGIAARSGPWSFGLGIENAVSRLSWARKPQQHAQRAWATDLTAEDLDDVDADLVSTEDTTLAIGAFSTSLPRVLTLAAARTWRGLDWEVDLRQGFARRAGATTTPRLGLAASRPVWRFLEARGGIAFGGADGPIVAAGTGLSWSIFRADLGIATARGLDFTSPRGLGAAVSVGLRFAPDR